LGIKLVQRSKDKVCHINLFRFYPFEVPHVYDAQLILKSPKGLTPPQA
jgi:hypothetical protein